MKFLYVGDLHQDEKENVPIHRIDDFNETRKEKITEILNIAKTNQVKAILHGGDFFHRAKISNETITSIMEMWNNALINIDIQDLTFKLQSGIIDEVEFTKQINQYRNGNIPIISIIGNHDLIGEQIDSYPKTSLHVLETSGFLHIVDKENPIVYQENGVSVAITGNHYHRGLDKATSDKSGYCVTEKVQVNGKDVDFQIHLTHGMLTSTSYGKKFAHTTIYEIEPNTLADLTIGGHDHVGYDTVELNGKLFVNPGSPFRLSADKKEIARMPKVMLIDVTDKGIKLTMIPLKCAKAGNLVLSDDAKNLAKNKQSAMAKIQTMINQSSLQKGLRIADIIDNIGQADNIDEKILKDVQDKIIESMNLLQTPYNPTGEYYITRVELKNFLSHKDSAFDFEPGLNILAGESRSGKSAVLRALREVFTCSMTQPRDAIFFGASYFTITIYTSNGYIVTRKVERDEKKGFNGYEIYDPNTGLVSKYNTKSVGLVQEILGYNKIPLTEKKSVDINSIIQGDGWFYVGSNMTAPDRARLLGVVYGTHYADAANKEIASEIKKTNTTLNHTKKDKERLEIQKKEYDYLPTLNKTLEDSEKLLEQLEIQERNLEEMKRLYALLQSIQQEREQLEKVLSSLQFDYSKDLLELKEKSKNLELLHKYYNDMVFTVQQGREYRQVSNMLVVMTDARNLLEELNKKQQILEKDKETYQRFIDLDSKKKVIENEKITLNQTLQNLSNLDDAKSYLKTLQQSEKDLLKFKENAERAIQLFNTQKTIESQLTEQRQALNKLKTMPTLSDLKVFLEQRSQIDECKKLLETLNQITEDGKTQRKELQRVKEDLVTHIEEYKEELEKLGECPICHSKVDNIVVNALVKQHLDKVNN